MQILVRFIEPYRRPMSGGDHVLYLPGPERFTMKRADAEAAVLAGAAEVVGVTAREDELHADAVALAEHFMALRLQAIAARVAPPEPSVAVVAPDPEPPAPPPPAVVAPDPWTVPPAEQPEPPKE